MDYNQFMSAFKSAEGGYTKKANVDNKDAKTDTKIDQDLSKEGQEGKDTAPLSKYTKEHLATVKKENIVSKK